MSGPTTAESLRDAAALLAAVVRMDEAAQAAIVDHCDKDETLRAMAALFAITVQQAAGLDDAGLLVRVQSFVENIAVVTS